MGRKCWFFCSIFCILLFWSNLIFCQFSTTFYAGLTNNRANLTSIQLIGETDSLVPNHGIWQVNASWGLGSTYRWTFKNVNLLNDFSAGADVFYFKTKRYGDVWQYQIPDFNNLNYTLSASSLRFMLDTEWGLRPIFLRYFPFIQFGFGFSRNVASYHDTPNPGINLDSISLNQSVQYQFACQLGGGIRISIRKNLDLSFRYLYTWLNAATINNNSAIVAMPLDIPLSAQSWLMALTYLY